LINLAGCDIVVLGQLNAKVPGRRWISFLHAVVRVMGAIPFIVSQIKIGLATIGKDKALPMPDQSVSVNASTIVA